MCENGKFVFEKIWEGLSSNHINQPLTCVDMERLIWRADEYKKLPELERNEWSRKILRALQVAFIDDTERLKDKDKIIDWRIDFTNIGQKSLFIDTDDLTVLQISALHFLKNDLLHHSVKVFGYKNLVKEEQELIDAFFVLPNIWIKKNHQK
jgi:hypothetical protein